MRNVCLILFLILWSAVGFCQARISFDTTLFDFGDIHQTSGVIIGKFLFTNTGTEPLIIDKAYSTGGILTVTDYPKDTISINASGVIFFMCSVEATSTESLFNKSITVSSNATPSMHFLLVKGKIMPRKSEPSEEQDIRNGIEKKK
ncbi:MAG: DUF1573 domain-containing protein [Crocinitomicaceae bacterium]|nr:DUF1573 domain-containing protein [Crocinitomicaceae bacterium]